MGHILEEFAPRGADSFHKELAITEKGSNNENESFFSPESLSTHLSM